MVLPLTGIAQVFILYTPIGSKTEKQKHHLRINTAVRCSRENPNPLAQPLTAEIFTTDDGKKITLAQLTARWSRPGAALVTSKEQGTGPLLR